ncbi:hypothetical protein Tco_0868182 [Tanacetum coccineum]
MDEDPQIASIAETHHQYHSPQADKPQSSHAPSIEASYNDSSCDDTLKKYDNTLPLTERQLVKYLRKVSTALFGRIVGKMIKRDQTDKLVEASMSSLNKSNNTISDLYKCLNYTSLCSQEINDVVKDNPVITKISTNMTKVLSLVKGFNFSVSSGLCDMAHQAHVSKQDEELAAWAKSSTNMAWNLGSRLSGIKRAQNHIQSNMSSLKEDTHSIKNMMTEMILKSSNPEEETDANRQEKSEEPKHSTDANIELIGKCIATDEQVKDQRKLVKASSIIRPDPDALIPYTINGEKVEEEARLLAISKPKVIKVVQEEAENIRLDPKKIASDKAGEKFKKAQDAEHEVLKRQHTKKSLSMGSSSLMNSVTKHFKDGLDSDIDKVGMEALVSYLVAAFMVQSPENARFTMKLKKLIVEHHDQEKLKSKKVK